MSKELADRVVAFVGIRHEDTRMNEVHWHLPNEPCQFADEFISDWRVAGCLMEKFPLPYDFEGAVLHRIREVSPTAIIQACVEALEVK